MMIFVFVLLVIFCSLSQTQDSEDLHTGGQPVEEGGQAADATDAADVGRDAAKDDGGSNGDDEGGSGSDSDNDSEEEEEEADDEEEEDLISEREARRICRAFRDSGIDTTSQSDFDHSFDQLDSSDEEYMRRLQRPLQRRRFHSPDLPTDLEDDW